MSKPAQRLVTVVMRASVYVLSFKYLPRCIGNLIIKGMHKLMEFEPDPVTTPEGSANPAAYLALLLILVGAVIVMVLKTKQEADSLAAKSPSAPHPPAAAEFVLYLFLDRKDREAIVGDLEEDFATDYLPRFGFRWATVLCWWDVARSIVPIVWMWLRRIAAVGTIFEAVRRFFKWL